MVIHHHPVDLFPSGLKMRAAERARRDKPFRRRGESLFYYYYYHYFLNQKFFSSAGDDDPFLQPIFNSIAHDRPERFYDKCCS